MTTFRTVVTHLPPTPLGLLPARWHTEHRCDTCGATVPTPDLVPHAKAHDHATTTDGSRVP